MTETKKEVLKIIKDAQNFDIHRDEATELILEIVNKGKQEAEMGFAEWTNSGKYDNELQKSYNYVLLNNGSWAKMYRLPDSLHTVDTKTSSELYQMYHKWLEEQHGK